LPNTYYAKFSSFDAIGGLGRIIGEVVLRMPAMFLWSGVLLYVLGILYMLKRGPREALVTIVYPWLFMISIAATRQMPHLSGQYYYWLRYVVPALPFLFVPLSLGFGFLWAGVKRFPRLGLKTNIINLARLVAALLVMVSWVKLPGELRFRSNQFAWNCQNINEVQVELGRWVSEETPHDAVIAVNDSGALRYFGGRKTIDLIGLNNRTILFDRQLATELKWNVSSMMEFLKSENAHYLIIFPSWFAPLVQTEEFMKNFKLINYRHSKNYTICAAHQDFMAVYLWEY